MKLKILLFGIARDIVGGAKYDLEMPVGASVADLKVTLENRFPSFRELTSLMVAVNSEYGDGLQELKENDEIAIIPPVSGG
ncbi:MAG: MoaD/ThiS family protein [Cyclobacteriaceae bacterium]|nr:MoaD/ThiS family protein [Cyclobacteriaceae bacterium]